jgi:hypothetical protein
LNAAIVGILELVHQNTHQASLGRHTGVEGCQFRDAENQLAQ